MPPSDGGDELGVLAFRVADQDLFGFVPLVVGHDGGQHVECMADRADVVVTDFAVLDRLGQLGQFRRQLGSGQGAPRPDARGDAHAAADLTGADPQPLPQQLAHHRARGQLGSSGPSGGSMISPTNRYISPRLTRS